MSGIKCLYIDDDEDDLNFFQSALTELDERHTCFLAKNCEDAQKLVSENENFTLDFIVLDMHMPTSSGSECLMKLRQTEIFKDISVFIYSTNIHSLDMERTSQYKVTDYIVKPASYEEIKVIVGQMLTRLHSAC
jgi:response regulator of citrate/malate metabolism